MDYLLSVQGLKTAFETERGKVISVDDVSFDLKPGETVAIVGESGSGKSVTALSIIRLLGKQGRIEQGEIIFDGKDLTSFTEEQMQKTRGAEISMVFQEPMTSLNPVLTIGFQLIEAIRLHVAINKKEAHQMAVEMLEKVGIPQPERVMKQYPDALSGGMRQRIVIAIALVCKPRLLIADEPTTALDVTVQAQIMRLLNSLCRELGTSILLITHDLGVVAEMADRVIVMYAGQVIEATDVFTLFEHIRHPYTKGLLNSIPSMEFDDKELISIPGTIPSHYQRLPGCRFYNRCPLATEHCLQNKPPLIDTGNGHMSRCFRWKELLKEEQPNEQHKN